jgi:hypothetical protein
MTAAEEELMAKELVDYYTICFAHPAVEGILMWGFWAGANWIPASSLYRKDWSPTKAATAYQELIHKKWHTTVNGRTNREGTFTTPAFYGKYKITAGGKSRIVEFNKASEDLVVDM